MSEAKVFQEWDCKVGDVFLCVDDDGCGVYTKGKEYVVIRSPDTGVIVLTDAAHTNEYPSFCGSTVSTFIKKQKEEKKMRKMLKTNWSLEWSKDNAAVIVKTLDALGIPVYAGTISNPTDSQSKFTYLAESGREACGYGPRHCDHFKHLEDFLAWYFKPEKTAKEVEIEALDAKIEELKAQVAKLKGVM